MTAGVTLVMTGFEAFKQWKEDIEYINENGFKNWQSNNKANGKFSPWSIYDRDPSEANNLTGVKSPFLSNSGGFNTDLVKSPFDIKGWIGDAKKVFPNGRRVIGKQEKKSKSNLILGLGILRKHVLPPGIILKDIGLKNGMVLRYGLKQMCLPGLHRRSGLVSMIL